MVALAIAVLVYRLRNRCYLSVYLYFIRVPIALGLVIFLLPIYAPRIAPDSFSNLFVLSWIEMAFSTFLATVASCSLLYVGRLIWISAPARCELFFDVRQHLNYIEGGRGTLLAAARNLDPRVLGVWEYLVTGLGLTISLPICSRDPDGTQTNTWLGYLLGLGLAAGILYLTRWVDDIRMRHATASGVHVWVPGAAKALPDSLRDFHRAAFVFFVIAFVVYLGFFVIGNPALVQWLSHHVPWLARCLNPSLEWSSHNVPALAYLYLLASFAVWPLGFLTFQFDVCRAPVFTLLVASFIVLHYWLPTTNYYRVTTVAQADDVKNPEQAVASWWWKRGRPSTLTAVACSGGGISAAYWSASVLRHLEEIPEFGRSVALMSSVSGGGLGAMLYVDAFTKDATPMDQMEQIVDKAGTSCLAAVVWSMTYPDLWRLFAGEWVGTDRGEVMESVWRGFFRDGSPMLSDWRAGVLEGWRPLLIFNATHQESGQRLTLSPFPSGLSIPHMRTSLDPQHDLRVVTAARLSAAFPFVSPHARPDTPGAVAGGDFHVADGGYFDNSGLVSILEVLNELTDIAPQALKRVAIVEIRASPRYTHDVAEKEQQLPKLEFPGTSDSNILNDVMGPLETLTSVRGASQSARNEMLVRLAARIGTALKIELRSFTFVLSAKVPLSWHLTDAERSFLTHHWPGEEGGTREELKRAGLDDAAVNSVIACQEWNRRAMQSLKSYLATK